MRLIPHLCSLLLATVFLAIPSHAADRGQRQLIPESAAESRGNNDERVTLQVVLVIASDEGATDASLAAHEATLKRVLRFKSYRRAGGGSTTLADGGEATVAIGRGFNIDFWVTRITDKEVEYGVRWFKGNLTLANTKVTRQRRSTTVIGGPAAEDGKGTYAVIVSVN